MDKYTRVVSSGRKYVTNRKWKVGTMFGIVLSIHSFSLLLCLKCWDFKCLSFVLNSLRFKRRLMLKLEMLSKPHIHTVRFYANNRFRFIKLTTICILYYDVILSYRSVPSSMKTLLDLVIVTMYKTACQNLRYRCLKIILCKTEKLLTTNTTISFL